MNSLQLEQRVRAALPPTSCNFLGVFARDEPPQVERMTRYPLAWISNTDIARSVGEHWVAFYCASPSSPCEFFDSYALPYASYCIPMRTRFASLIHANDRQLQAENSNVCGLWCLYYLVTRAQNKFLHNRFSKNDFAFNDRLLVRLCSRMCKRKRRR